MTMASKPTGGAGANLRITLEQWQALQAVVDHGSYARAAEALHKSQSAVTYAVQKVQSLLGVNAFEIRGRKAVLLGDSLMRLRFIAVAHPDHPLHRLGRELGHRDLARHRQLVIRDSGMQRTRASGWLGAEQRWTVSNKATSIRAATLGLGFAWYPEENIRDELASGVLKPLPLRQGAEKWAELYLVFAERDHAARDTLRLAAIIREAVAAECARQPATDAISSRRAGAARDRAPQAAKRRAPE